MEVTNLETKSHDAPDEVRTPDKTRVEVVRLKDFTIGRFIFQPGWLACSRGRLAPFTLDFFPRSRASVSSKLTLILSRYSFRDPPLAADGSSAYNAKNHHCIS